MCNCKMCMIHKVAGLLVIIGALNWGLIGISPEWNLVHMILGSVEWLERLVYILVGVSALALLMKGKCKACKMDGSMMKKEGMGGSQM